MKKKIRVTAENINNGIRLRCMHCPIALAAKEAGLDGAIVMNKFIVVAGYEQISLPPEATAFIRDFDIGEKVVPVSFTVEVRKI